MAEGTPSSGVVEALPGPPKFIDLAARTAMHRTTMTSPTIVNILIGCIPSGCLDLPLPRPADPPVKGFLATMRPNNAVIIVM